MLTSAGKYRYNQTLREKFFDAVTLAGEQIPVILFIAGFLTVSAGILIITNGEVTILFALLLIAAILMITLYRIDISYFIIIGCVLLFDQFGIPGFRPLTYKLDYFRNLKEISFLPYFEAGVANPIELHLVLLFFAWFILLAIKKQFRFSRIPVWTAFVLFLGWIISSFVYGMRNNGEFLVALWEVRALCYLSVFYLITPHIITTRAQLTTLVWIFIAAITVKALQGIMRYAVLGFSFQGRATLTNHEDPVFMVTLFIFLIAGLLYNLRHKQLYALLLLFLPLMLGFAMALRRAAIASLLVSLAVFPILLSGRELWKFAKVGVPVLVFILVYGAAMWNVENTLSMPVQMVKSGIMTDKEELSEEDYYSNLYRDYENYNLAYTVKKNPLLGVGYGNLYEKPLSLANISFSLRDYIPHNQIYWVMVKTGVIGFFTFWFFFNAFAYRSVHIHKSLSDPYLKTICAVIIIAIINQMVVSFFDLQLTYYRNMIYLGTLMGLLPVLERLDKEKQDEEKYNLQIDENSRE